MALHHLRICLGSSCFSRGNEECLEFIKKYLLENNLKDKVEFRGHLCVEKCKIGPNLKIDDVTYNQININNLGQILDKHFKK